MIISIECTLSKQCAGVETLMLIITRTSFSENVPNA